MFCDRKNCVTLCFFLFNQFFQVNSNICSSSGKADLEMSSKKKRKIKKKRKKNRKEKKRKEKKKEKKRNREELEVFF